MRLTTASMAQAGGSERSQGTPGRGWRPGNRVERVRESHSYGFVLIVIGATFLFLFAAPEETWADSVAILLECALLASAIWTSGLGMARPIALLFAVGVVVALVPIVFPGDTMRGALWLVGVGLVLTTIVVIGVGVLDQREINRQSISGAVCVYLLLGILFAFAYGAVAELQSGPFFAQGTDGTTGIRSYFSYVTLATLGYGDYTPGAPLGRALAVTEALLGQLYLVTIVALLVGRFGQRREPRSSRVSGTSA